MRSQLNSPFSEFDFKGFNLEKPSPSASESLDALMLWANLIYSRSESLSFINQTTDLNP